MPDYRTRVTWTDRGGWENPGEHESVRRGGDPRQAAVRRLNLLMEPHKYDTIEVWPANEERRKSPPNRIEFVGASVYRSTTGDFWFAGADIVLDADDMKELIEWATATGNVTVFKIVGGPVTLEEA